MKTLFLFCTERASFSLVIFEKTIIIGLELRKNKESGENSIETDGWSIWFI